MRLPLLAVTLDQIIGLNVIHLLQNPHTFLPDPNTLRFARISGIQMFGGNVSLELDSFPSSNL